jgi:hypothetical protein
MRNAISTLILSLLLPTTCFPQQKVISRIPVLRHPYYGPNVLPALKELVAERGKSKRNHFYVGRVEVFEGGYESVLVYWKENRALVLWEPGRGLNLQGVPDARYDLWHSRRYWDLDKDVVPTLADVGGSSFLVTKQDAHEWIRKCLQSGERFVVNRTAQSNKRLQPTPR